MKDNATRLRCTDEDILACEISDAALETAGDTGKETARSFTLGACTGLSVCDG